MKESRLFTVELSGDYALFSHPATKIGGDKHSYPVPTYGALIGALEQIYYKPTIRYRINRIRIMNKVQYESMCKNNIFYNDGTVHNPTYNTYLRDVRYQIEALMEFNLNRDDMADDRNMDKHFSILLRSIEAGGRRRVYFGTSECTAYVTPLEVNQFGKERGYYDGQNGELGVMFHSFVYPNRGWDDVTRTHISAVFWHPKMENGIINCFQPEECTMIRQIRPMQAQGKIKKQKGTKT